MPDRNLHEFKDLLLRLLKQGAAGPAGAGGEDAVRPHLLLWVQVDPGRDLVHRDPLLPRVLGHTAWTPRAREVTTMFCCPSSKSIHLDALPNDGLINRYLQVILVVKSMNFS